MNITKVSTESIDHLVRIKKRSGKASMKSLEDNPAKTIKEFIKTFVLGSLYNRLEHLDDSPISEKPLVCFGESNDPLISEFKEAVGSFHLTPQELWQQSFHKGAPSNLSIIAWALPFSKAIRDSNRRRRIQPSPHWGHARLNGEILNNELRSALVSLLTRHGYKAVAACQSPSFKVFWDNPEGPTSNWSERHYCFTAGLGTFGLNGGLITEKGQAMRCGSVITDLELPITGRRYDSHTSYCPYLVTGGCGDCIERCPTGCISPQGKDNAKCYRYLSKNLDHLIPEYFPEDALRDPQGKVYGRMYFCGLCHTDVPCEAGIPPKRFFRSKVGNDRTIA